MSKQIEAPAADDGHVSIQDKNTVADAMFRCAFEGILPTSTDSNNGSENSLSNVLNNTVVNDRPNRTGSADTTGGTADRVMNSLGGLHRSGSPEGTLPTITGAPAGSLGSLLPDVRIVGNVIPFDKNRRPQNQSGSHPPIDNLPPVRTPGPIESGNQSGSHPPIDNLPPVRTPGPIESGNPNGSSLPPIENGRPPVRTRPDDSGSQNGSRPPIDTLPPVRTRPDDSGSQNGSRPPIDTLPPVRTRPDDSGSQNGSRPPIDTLPPVRTRPDDSGSQNGSRPPVDTLPPVRTRPDDSGSQNGSRPPIDTLPPVRTRPDDSGSQNGSRPPGDTTTPPVTRPGDNGGRGNEVRPLPEIDRSPHFRFPKDTPMDPKESQELAEKAAKLIKDGLANGGEFKFEDRQRLAEALRYGINHGEQGLKGMVSLINKQLEGTGLELKTDGQAHAYYQTCFPDRRGDYHGDFVYFNIAQGDKNVEWAQVKVGPGDFDRDRW